MQNPLSYHEAISHKNGEDTPSPFYDEVVRPDSPEPQPPIIGSSADRKLIDPFVVPQQEDMPPPIPARYLKKHPVSDTDQKITHNRNRQELLLALPILDQGPHPTLIDSKKADMPPERISSIGSLNNDAKELKHPLDQPTLRIIAHNTYSDVEGMFFKHFFYVTSPHFHHVLNWIIFTVFVRGFCSIQVALEKYSQRAEEYNVYKVIRYAQRGNKPILFIEEDEKRWRGDGYCEDDHPAYIIGEQKLHNVEHIKKAVQDIVDAELVRKGILPSKRSLDSLESATDLLLEAINLAISKTSCGEKINKLQRHVEAIGNIKSNQRYLTCDQWSAAVDSLKVICDSAKAVICAHRNLAMNALTFLNVAPPTRSFEVSKPSFDQVEALLSELMPREDHGHSESLSL